MLLPAAASSASAARSSSSCVPAAQRRPVAFAMFRPVLLPGSLSYSGGRSHAAVAAAGRSSGSLVVGAERAVTAVRRAAPALAPSWARGRRSGRGATAPTLLLRRYREGEAEGPEAPPTAADEAARAAAAEEGTPAEGAWSVPASLRRPPATRPSPQRRTKRRNGIGGCGRRRIRNLARPSRQIGRQRVPASLHPPHTTSTKLTKQHINNTKNTTPYRPRARRVCARPPLRVRPALCDRRRLRRARRVGRRARAAARGARALRAARALTLAPP